MDILHEQENSKGAFYAVENGVRKAEMTYTFAGNDKIIIDHTEVDETLKGQGIGYKLLAEVVKMAREKGLKILPLCPFAKYAMEKGSAYKELIF